MKLYKDKHFGKITKDQNLKIKSLSKSVIGGVLLGISIITAPVASGDTLVTLCCNELSEELYDDTINDYNNIINNVANLIKKLNISNPDDIFYLVSLLIQSGELSIDKTFCYDNENAWDIRGYGGIDVLKGTAVCRHEAALLSDILNKCGYDSSVVINSFSTNNIEDKYHTVVFLYDDDSYKIYDPTNSCTGFNNEKLEIYLTNGSKIKLKPFSTYINGYTDISHAIKIYNTKFEGIESISNMEITKIDKNYLVKEVNKLREKNKPYIENICFREGYYEWDNSSKQKIKSYK